MRKPAVTLIAIGPQKGHGNKVYEKTAALPYCHRQTNWFLMRQVKAFLISLLILAACNPAEPAKKISEGKAEEAKKSVAIYTYYVQGMKPWGPDSIKKGITGSEEAVIYMSQALADLGYQVTVLGYPPMGFSYLNKDANPRYVYYSHIPKKPFDIAISWRMPWKGEELKRWASKVYLWPHDTFHSTLTDEQIMAFDGVLWISGWQQEQWRSVNPLFDSFSPIFGNGLPLDQFPEVVERTNPYSCIYGSNYARGLEILLDIWPDVKKEAPEATLDIYYGWVHWGLLTPDQEEKMRGQVADLAPLGVTEHGLVSHEELTKAYAKASFWTYPCICPEVFCITALRAQSAGAVPVIIQGTALKETVRHGYFCENDEEYLPLLLKAMSDAKGIELEKRKRMRDFILEKYTWNEIALQWKNHFEKDL